MVLALALRGAVPVFLSPVAGLVTLFVFAYLVLNSPVGFTFAIIMTLMGLVGFFGTLRLR